MFSNRRSRRSERPLIPPNKPNHNQGVIKVPFNDLSVKGRKAEVKLSPNRPNSPSNSRVTKPGRVEERKRLPHLQVVSSNSSRTPKLKVGASNRINEVQTPPQPVPSSLIIPHQHVSSTQGEIVGGRLANFWKEWRDRGAHPWVVGVLRWGYPIQFSQEPPVTRHPVVQSGYADMEMDRFLEESINALLLKQAIEPVSNPESRGFYSRLFLRPKASGG